MRVAPILLALPLPLSTLPGGPRADARGRAPSAQQPAAQRPAARDAGGDGRELQALLAAVAGERQKDADAWFRLGIEYNRAGDAGEARKSFHQALKLRSRFPAARAGVAYTYFMEKKYDEAQREAVQALGISGASDHMAPHRVFTAAHLEQYRELSARISARADQELTRHPDAAEWHALKAQALLGLAVSGPRLTPEMTYAPVVWDEASMRAARESRAAHLMMYREAAEHLKAYLRLAPKARDADFQRQQLQALRAYVESSEDATPPAFPAPEGWEKAVLLKKPEPGMTEEARHASANGVVRVRALLDADGAVKHVLVVKPLGYGLTEQALDAARRIKFKPAVKDGRPASQWVTIEYNFNVY